MTKDEKKLKKIENKLNNYINTKIGVETEYNKYKSESAQKTFPSKESHQRYLTQLTNQIESLNNKIEYLNKDIKVLREKLEK